jgi:hypothetical protein
MHGDECRVNTIGTAERRDVLALDLTDRDYTDNTR